MQGFVADWVGRGDFNVVNLVVLLDVFSHFRGVFCLKGALGHIAFEATGILGSNAFAMLRGLCQIKTKVRSKLKQGNSLLSLVMKTVILVQ